MGTSKNSKPTQRPFRPVRPVARMTPPILPSYPVPSALAGLAKDAAASASNRMTRQQQRQQQQQQETAPSQQGNPIPPQLKKKTIARATKKSKKPKVESNDNKEKGKKDVAYQPKHQLGALPARAGLRPRTRLYITSAASSANPPPPSSDSLSEPFQGSVIATSSVPNAPLSPPRHRHALIAHAHALARGLRNIHHQEHVSHLDALYAHEQHLNEVAIKDPASKLCTPHPYSKLAQLRILARLARELEIDAARVVARERRREERRERKKVRGDKAVARTDEKKAGVVVVSDVGRQQEEDRPAAVEVTTTAIPKTTTPTPPSLHTPPATMDLPEQKTPDYVSPSPIYENEDEDMRRFDGRRRTSGKQPKREVIEYLERLKKKEQEEKEEEERRKPMASPGFGPRDDIDFNPPPGFTKLSSEMQHQWVMQRIQRSQQQRQQQQQRDEEGLQKMQQLQLQPQLQQPEQMGSKISHTQLHPPQAHPQQLHQQPPSPPTSPLPSTIPYQQQQQAHQIHHPHPHPLRQELPFAGTAPLPEPVSEPALTAPPPPPSTPSPPPYQPSSITPFWAEHLRRQQELRRLRRRRGE